MRNKTVKEKREEFAFRVKIGEYEVELRGTHEDVMKSIDSLPSLITNVNKAFESVKPKTVATLTVKTDAPKAEAPAQKYPKITSVANCEEAVLRILETDWGKWRPRTKEELKEAMKANKLKYSGSVLTKTLTKLVDKTMVRRWNTNAGFVYILAEEKPLSAGGEA